MVEIENKDFVIWFILKPWTFNCLFSFDFHPCSEQGHPFAHFPICLLLIQSHINNLQT